MVVTVIRDNRQGGAQVDIGPSEVRALPLAIVGRTWWPLLTVFFPLSLFLSPLVTFSQKELSKGSKIALHGVLIHTKKILGEHKFEEGKKLKRI